MLEIGFALILSWFDPRLTFTNLQDDYNFNPLTEVEKQIIWKPNIEFTNTKYKEVSVTDSKVVAKIVKYGNRMDLKESPVYNNYLYSGAENLLTFER